MSQTKPTKLTRAIEKGITEDWAREFPGLGVYKTRWLMRRTGPMVIGICLDRDSHGDLYKPSWHVFFLGHKWHGREPALTLDEPLRTRRTSAPDAIKVRWHEEKYLDAIERMKEQALLPLDGPVTIDQVLEAYRKHHERAPMGRPSLTWDIVLMSDVILLLAWCGRREEARNSLYEVLETVPDQPGNVKYYPEGASGPVKILQKPSPYTHPYGSREAFERAMRKAIDSPGTIHDQVERQIERLGVEKLPVSELLC